MIKYQCSNCKEFFDKPKIVTIGRRTKFGETYTTNDIGCPNCDSTQFEVIVEKTILDEQQDKQLGYLAGLLETVEEEVIDNYVTELLHDKLVDDKIAKIIQESFFEYYPELKGYLEKISQSIVKEEVKRNEVPCPKCKSKNTVYTCSDKLEKLNCDDCKARIVYPIRKLKVVEVSNEAKNNE